MDKEKSTIISEIATLLLQSNRTEAKSVICRKYPHTSLEIEKRTYTLTQKMNQFVSDGFIDRYTGQRLLNPGILKTISYYFPDEFPYQAHWKMSQTHIAYWELLPTIDHIYPIAKGGIDDEQNWVTTSMKNNSIKSNYTLDEIHWSLHPKGNIAEWDGLTYMFFDLVDKDRKLLEDAYIKNWYQISRRTLLHHR
jgi:hypothetical protein